MSRKLRLLLRLGGMVVIGMAVLGNLPGLWPLLAGATGAIMFFAAGPT